MCTARFSFLLAAGSVAVPALLLCGCQSSPTARETKLGNLDVEALIRLAGAKPQWFKSADRARLSKLVASQRCPCKASGGGVSLDGCLTKKPEGELKAACVRAQFAVRAVARGIKRGAGDAQIRRWFRDRFERRAARLDLRGTACQGAPTAPVTLTVFSDFQCPACAVGRQIGEVLLKHSNGQVRLCFKHFPLTTIHPDAMLASQAAVAAHKQGKFWAMHDLLFANQGALKRDDLQRHARSIGLDLAKFTADLIADDVKNAVLRDLMEADRLALRGTPTFFINARQMTGPMTMPDFLDWIAEAIAEAGEGGQPASMPTSAPASRPASQPAH